MKVQLFQLWKLTAHADQTAILTCENGNCDVVLTKPIGYTNFPLKEGNFHVTDIVILLPSEY